MMTVNTLAAIAIILILLPWATYGGMKFGAYGYYRGRAMWLKEEKENKHGS